VIEGLSKIISSQSVSGVVVHPAGITDWGVFKGLGARLLVENMDSVTPEGQDIDDLNKYFSEIDADMVLDLQHTYSIDKSMGLTNRLIDAFKG
jgi:hypothetical protein